MYWPSFNAGPQSGHLQHRAVVNTVLSMCGSCLAAFAASRLLRHEKKFSMVDIQNATLAGGVAVGAIADMVIQPVGALGVSCCVMCAISATLICFVLQIGMVGGTLSVVGYTIVHPFLDKRLGISDTCGAHNLHGMPG